MNTLIVVLLGLVTFVLIVGVVLMGVGGEMNARYSNKLMQARVLIQALIVALVAIVAFAMK